MLGVKYNILYITYFIVLSAAVNLKCEISQKSLKFVMLCTQTSTLVLDPLWTLSCEYITFIS